MVLHYCFWYLEAAILSFNCDSGIPFFWNSKKFERKRNLFQESRGLPEIYESAFTSLFSEAQKKVAAQTENTEGEEESDVAEDEGHEQVDDPLRAIDGGLYLPLFGPGHLPRPELIPQTAEVHQKWQFF